MVNKCVCLRSLEMGDVGVDCLEGKWEDGWIGEVGI